VGDEGRRESALTEFLAERVAQGFQVETRSDTQAIIARPRRAFGLLDRFRSRPDDARQVVSVDEHGVVIARPAEPIRW
jgi:hypothetical protein